RTPRGSTWSSGSSASSLKRRSGAARTRASQTYALQFSPTSTRTIRRASPSSGPRPLTRFSTRCAASVSVRRRRTKNHFCKKSRIQGTRKAMSDLEHRYDSFRQQKLALDMTRGKPSAEQLDLSNALLTILGPGDYLAADGTDCRNYGGLDGLPEAKELFAEFMEVSAREVLLGDNSSLALMHDAVARALSHGVPGGDAPWSRAAVKFLCPVPGYDRHFSVCEHFGIEMLNVAMTDEGPVMDEVEALAAADPAVKGIWIVPQYSNPTGVTCSDRVVE